MFPWAGRCVRQRGVAEDRSPARTLLAIVCAAAITVAPAHAQSPPAEDTEAVAEAMRAIGHRASNADLVFLLNRSDNKYIRSIAAKWLGERKILTAAEPLLAAMDDPERYVQSHAAVAYARVTPCQFPSGLIALFRAPRSSTRFVAIGASLEILKRCRAGTLSNASALVGGIRYLVQDDSMDVRREAIVLLRRIPQEVVGPRRVDLLLGCLDDPDGKVRQQAVRALSREADPRVAEALIGLLEDPERAVVISAVRALASSGNSPRARRAIRAMLGHRTAEFRIVAINTMVMMGDTEGSRSLGPVLSDRLPRVRQAAVEAVGALRPPNATSLLTPALSDRSAEVREAAARMLQEICPRGHVAAARGLARATADRSQAVGQAAVRALRCLRSTDNIESLVAAMCRCPHGATRSNISRLLDRATGAHPGNTCQAWRKWWQRQQIARSTTETDMETPSEE